MSKVSQEAVAFLNQFRSLVAFAESVSELGNVEGALNDLNREKDAIVTNRDKVRKELDDLSGQVKHQKLRLADVNKEIQDINNVALEAARHIRLDAKREATKLIEAAKEEIKQLHIDHQEKHSLAALEYSNVIRDIDLAKAELQRLNDGIAALRNKLS